MKNLYLTLFMATEIYAQALAKQTIPTACQITVTKCCKGMKQFEYNRMMTENPSAKNPFKGFMATSPKKGAIEFLCGRFHEVRIGTPIRSDYVTDISGPYLMHCPADQEVAFKTISLPMNTASGKVGVIEEDTAFCVLPGSVVTDTIKKGDYKCLDVPSITPDSAKQYLYLWTTNSRGSPSLVAEAKFISKRPAWTMSKGEDLSQLSWGPGFARKKYKACVQNFQRHDIVLHIRLGEADEDD